MLTWDLIQTLQKMNWSFGKGEIASVNINMDESNPNTGEVYGTVTRRFPGGMADDTRMFKTDGKTVTFLSHKRVLYVYSGRK